MKTCACARWRPHALTHALARCLVNFTSVCKPPQPVSVLQATVPRENAAQPHAWLPGDRVTPLLLTRG